MRAIASRKRHRRDGSVSATRPARLARLFTPARLVAAAWLLPAILSGFEGVIQAQFTGETRSWRQVLFNSLDWLVYAFLTPGVFALARRWPLTAPPFWRRALAQFGGALLFCAAWAVLGTALRAVIQPEMLRGGVALYMLRWFVITLPFGVAVYLALVGVEHALFAVAEVRARDVRMARLAEQLSEARLSALEARVNPHFLFNSLNTITVLVRDGDARAATQVIEQLSLVLRASLDAAAPSDVTLREELEVTQHYLAVETARFPDRLRVTLDVAPDALDGHVPRLAVQHLVENAIRHGVAPRIDAGHLHVAARRDGSALVVTVTDDGPGVSTAEWPAGHGLAGTVERLATLYGPAAQLHVGARADGQRGTQATLRLPWRAHAAAVSPDTHEPSRG